MEHYGGFWRQGLTDTTESLKSASATLQSKATDSRHGELSGEGRALTRDDEVVALSPGGSGVGKRDWILGLC